MREYSKDELQVLIDKASDKFDFDNCAGACPYCGLDMIVINPAIYNAQRTPITTRTYCCGNYVKFTPIVSITIEQSEIEVDDYVID